jgi:hypothetical protein
MQTIKLSLATLLAISTLSTSSIANDVPVLNEFYIGAAYGILGASYEETVLGDIVRISSDEDFSQAMLQVGYKINPYFAFEGRYWVGMSDQSWENTFDEGLTAQVDTMGIYTKFILPVGNSFDIYALIGYATSTYSINGESLENGEDDFDGISWGIGANFSLNYNMGVYIDYVGLYNDDLNNYRDNDSSIQINSLNFGVTFTF